MTFVIKMFCNMHEVYTLALLRKYTSFKLMDFAGMPRLDNVVISDVELQISHRGEWYQSLQHL